MAEAVKIITRPANDSDRGFILSSWLKGQRYGCAYFERMPQQDYYDTYSAVVRAILAQESTDVTVATAQNDPLWAVGYAVTRGPELYWVFVKSGFRGMGIAKLLLAGKGIKTVRSTTQLGLSIVKQKGLTYIPL